jgi:hypothetical protein
MEETMILPWWGASLSNNSEHGMPSRETRNHAGDCSTPIDGTRVGREITNKNTGKCIRGL